MRCVCGPALGELRVYHHHPISEMRTPSQRLFIAFAHILRCRRLPVCLQGFPCTSSGALGNNGGGASYYLSITEEVLSSGTIRRGFGGQEGDTCVIQVFTIRAARPTIPACPASRACDCVAPLLACKLPGSGRRYSVSQRTDGRCCLRLPTSPDWPRAVHSK